MLLSDLSIKRPVFASVMMLALVTLGIFSYRRLAIDMFPDVEIPVITITTIFPGASPETVEREVTKRIEEAVNPIPGVKHVESNSREGVSLVVVEFQLEVRINDVSQEARAKISAIRSDLPQSIEEPVIQKLDFSAAPICSLAVRSAAMPPQALTKLVEKRIKTRIESLPGVGKADLVGESKREVQVEIRPERLEALGMGVDEVMLGLQSENVNIPLGRLKRGNTEYSLRLSGKPAEVSQFMDMVITHRQGRPVKLSEVATVVDGIEEQRSLALINGVPAVALDVMKQSGANTVGVVESVKAAIEKLKTEIPADTSIELVRDGSVMIRESVADVQDTLIIGALLTIFIVFLFLNSWRSTVITGLTLPISVISSFIIMNFMGMTLNIMTLMALSLAIGLLIDDAIVVRENIVRHLEHGQDHYTAARKGTSEIGLAVLATTFSIIAVFVPVAFMKGIVGKFFYHFGITVAFAVLVSLFVSFTLDPMLSSIWYDPDIERKGKRHLLNRVLDRFNNLFEHLANVYRRLMGWSLDHRWVIVMVAFAAFAGGLMTLATLENTFMEQWDQNEFLINFQTAPDASIDESHDRIEDILAGLKQYPEVVSTYATIGAGEWGTVRDASVYVKLVDKDLRTRDQFQIQRSVRQMLQGIPGITPYLKDPGDMDTRKPVMVSIQGEDLEKLKAYGAALKKQLYGIPGLVDLDVTLEQQIPEYKFYVDRTAAVDRRVTSADIVRTVGTLIGGQAVTTYEDEDGDAVNLRVRLPENLRQDPGQVGQLRLALLNFGQSPSLIPLRDLVRYELSNTPSEITRRDLSREVVVSANLDQLALGTAEAKINDISSSLNLEPGYRIALKGQNEDMKESNQYMAEALMLAIIFVYLILAAQFESFIDPLSIMLSLPLSIVGMAGMLKLTGDTLNIMSQIGLIMLMGLVTKNAILLVDFAKVLRKGGLTRREAVITAGRTRLRPIMMTTLAMIFGMLPLAFAIGSGAEMRAPMARAIVGGLITSTFLTLLVVPVVYTLLDDISAWLFRHHKKDASLAPGTALAGEEHQPAVAAEER